MKKLILTLMLISSTINAPEVKEPIEVIRHALPDSVVVVVTSLNIILVGYDLGFKYASGVQNGSAKTI
jgi:hypothetical protein